MIKIKNSEKIIHISIILLLLILLLNIFLIKFLNEYIISIIFFIVISILVKLYGYEKNNHLNKKEALTMTIFYNICYICLLYGLGLFTGYVKSSYSHKLVTIIKNIAPVILYILSSELLRYQLCTKGQKRKSIAILTIILFILADLSFSLNIYNINNTQEYFELLTLVFIPSIIKNIVLTKTTVKYGLTTNIAYRLILELYQFLIPILPNINIYLESVILTVYPIILYYIINSSVERIKKVEIKQSKATKIINYILILLILLIVALNSNLFRFWIAVVGSGSMEPTINIGDVVLIDKSYQERVDELKVGDVIVFSIKDEMYTHRIIRIEENNEIYTKGDRKGNVEDNWIVKEGDIIGLVKFKISYIGYPSLWIKELMEE